MPTSSLDHDLLLFQRTRDPQALAAVFDAAAPRLLLVAMHLVRDAAAAEDLVQAVFLQVLRDVDRFDPRRPALPWLLGMLEHRASDLRARAHRRRERGAMVDEVAAGAPSPPRAAADAELRQRLAEALAGMPGEYRDVLTLRLVHGLRAVDIAHAHGQSPATVRTRLRRGLELLRGALPRGLATPGLLALLGAELARAQDGLRAVRSRVLAAATGSAATVGATALWLALAACALLAFGGWLWLAPTDAAVAPIGPPAGPAVAAVAARADGAPVAPAPSPIREAVAAATAPGRATALRGRVVDAASGAPLAGIRVQAAAHADPERGEPDPDWCDPPPVHTDVHGAFVLQFVPSPVMELTLEFRGERHCTDWRSFAPLRDGVQVDTGDVPLERGTPVRLVLATERGPAGGVEVFAARAEDGVRPNGMNGCGATDREGAVALGVCAPGRWFVEARTAHPGAEASFDVPLQDDVLELRLGLREPPRERSISGVLVDTAGAPVPGVELALPWSPGHLTATTRLDGAFLWAIAAVPEQPAARTIELWGRPDLAWVEHGGPVAWATHELRLVVRHRAPATLELDVVDAGTQQPVEQFAATCWLDPWADGQRARAELRRGPSTARPGGRATFAGLAAGAYFVSVFPPSPWAERAELPVALAEGERRALRVELTPPAELVVDAVDAGSGAPVPGVEVALAKVVPAARRHLAKVGAYRLELEHARSGRGSSSSHATLVLARATTGGDGRARLLAPADVPGLVLFAEGPRCVAAVRHDVELPRGGAATTIAVVPAGEVRGALGPRALLERCGPSPAALASLAQRARTELVDERELASSWPRVELRPFGRSGARVGTHVAPDGTFTIGALPAGRYEAWIEVEANGPDEQWFADCGPLATIDVQAGANPPLRLDAPQLVPARATVQFFVDGSAWQGPAGLRMVAPEPGNVVTLRPDASGTARTAWLRPGTWLPFATVVDAAGDPHPIAGTTPVVVAAAGDVHATAVLQRRRVALVLRDRAGAAVAGRWVQACSADSRENGARARRCSGPTGEVVLDPAPPGRLEVRAWRAGGRPGDGSEPERIGEVAAHATAAALVLPH